MRNNTIIVFDLETSSNKVAETEIVQIAAMAMNPATLEPIPNARFESLMRPLDWDKVEDQALAVNKKTREELADAPHPEEVWDRFLTWTRFWKLGASTSKYVLPDAAGHNIINFDLPIMERYCRKYGTVRTESNGEVRPNLFSPMGCYDTLNLLNYWMEDLPDGNKLSLDYWRKHLGMPKESLEKGHDAMQDVKDTFWILQRLLKLSRRVGKNIVWKDAFDHEKAQAEVERRKAVKKKEFSRR